MSTGEEVFRRLQAAARSTASKTGSPAPTQEYLTRHVLESFLDRLTRSRHGDAFVIKGGILLASYGWRRATKDVDVNAVSADVTPAHLVELVRDLAAMELDEGVVFDVGSIEVTEIREEADYPGFRVRVGPGSGCGEVPRPGMSPPGIRSSRHRGWCVSSVSTVIRSRCSAMPLRPASRRRG